MTTSTKESLSRDTQKSKSFTIVDKNNIQQELITISTVLATKASENTIAVSPVTLTDLALLNNGQFVNTFADQNIIRQLMQIARVHESRFPVATKLFEKSLHKLIALAIVSKQLHKAYDDPLLAAQYIAHELKNNNYFEAVYMFAHSAFVLRSLTGQEICSDYTNTLGIDWINRYPILLNEIIKEMIVKVKETLANAATERGETITETALKALAVKELSKNEDYINLMNLQAQFVHIRDNANKYKQFLEKTNLEDHLKTKQTHHYSQPSLTNESVLHHDDRKMSEKNLTQKDHAQPSDTIAVIPEKKNTPKSSLSLWKKVKKILGMRDVNVLTASNIPTYEMKQSITKPLQVREYEENSVEKLISRIDSHIHMLQRDDALTAQTREQMKEILHKLIQQLEAMPGGKEVIKKKGLESYRSVSKAELENQLHEEHSNNNNNKTSVSAKSETITDKKMSTKTEVPNSSQSSSEAKRNKHS